MTHDNGAPTTSLHLFHVYVALNRIECTSLPDDIYSTHREYITIVILCLQLKIA